MIKIPSILSILNIEVSQARIKSIREIAAMVLIMVGVLLAVIMGFYLLNSI